MTLTSVDSAPAADPPTVQQEADADAQALPRGAVERSMSGIPVGTMVRRARLVTHAPRRPLR